MMLSEFLADEQCTPNGGIMQVSPNAGHEGRIPHGGNIANSFAGAARVSFLPELGRGLCASPAFSGVV